MTNKPTKAQYEGFKKALANPMTPQPIKDKLQSVIEQYASEYEGGSQAPKAEPKSRAGRKPSTTKKYKPLPTPKMVAMVTATTQAFAEMKARLKKFGYDPEKVDALSDNEAFAILEEVKGTMTKRKPSTPRATKKTATDIEKAKAEIKAKTGKTEEECESIIEQYRDLRAKAQTRKAKEEEASKENKKRVEKLDKKGDIIEGTNEKTADAVIETATQEVADKIEKQIEVVEQKAEKEAKAEVAKDKTLKTPKAKKEAVDKKVEQKVAEKTKTIVKRVVIDTSALLESISNTLGKFDNDSKKEFLIKLRSDIDKLLAKFAFGGITNGAVQPMNIQQSNLSSSSVNPSQFANGGGVRSYKKGGGMFGEDAKLQYINDAFASYGLQDELRTKLGIDENAYSVGDNVVISFAYTDYGGDFLDKVAIRYFEENYPENTLVENAGYGGQNAFVFGEPAQEWIDTTDDYPLGFENIEDLYYEMQNQAEYESFDMFLDDLERDDYVFDRDEVMNWLMENRGGYYSMTTQGLDFSYSDLTEELIDEGLISKEDEEEYEKGGEVDEDPLFAVVTKKGDKNYNKIGYSKLTEFITDKEGNEFDKIYFEGKKLPTKYSADDLNYVNTIDTFTSTSGRKFILLKEFTDDNRIYYYILHFDDKKVYAESYDMNFIKSEIKRLTNGKNFYSKAGVNFAKGGGVDMTNQWESYLSKPDPFTGLSMMDRIEQKIQISKQAEKVWKNMTREEKYNFVHKNFTPKIGAKEQQAILNKSYGYLPMSVQKLFEKKFVKSDGVSSMLRNRRGK